MADRVFKEISEYIEWSHTNRNNMYLPIYTGIEPTLLISTARIKGYQDVNFLIG